MFDRKTLAQWQDALEAYDRGELTQEDLDELLARASRRPACDGRPTDEPGGGPRGPGRADAAPALGGRSRAGRGRGRGRRDEWLIDPRYG